MNQNHISINDIKWRDPNSLNSKNLINSLASENIQTNIITLNSQGDYQILHSLTDLEFIKGKLFLTYPIKYQISKWAFLD